MNFIPTSIVVSTVVLGSGCIIPYKEHVPTFMGRAVDADTGRPISGATAVIHDFPETLSCGISDGTFQTLPAERWHIYSMPLGHRIYHYQLHITAPHYEETRLGFVRRKPSFNYVGDVRLTRNTSEGPSSTPEKDENKPASDGIDDSGEINAPKLRLPPGRTSE